MNIETAFLRKLESLTIAEIMCVQRLYAAVGRNNTGEYEKSMMECNSSILQNFFAGLTYDYQVAGVSFRCMTFKG